MSTTRTPFLRRLAPMCLGVMLVLASWGCTRNAALEVTFDLPPTPEGVPDRHYAFAQFDRPPASFDRPWTNTADFDGAELGPSRRFARYSLVTDRLEGNLLVRMRFCSSPRCDADGDVDAPSRLYVVESPFHRGHRTAWTAVIEAYPTEPDGAPTLVGRCEISGCIAGYRGAPSYCRADGSHFCDPPGAVPPSDAGARGDAR